MKILSASRATDDKFTRLPWKIRAMKKDDMLKSQVESVRDGDRENHVHKPKCKCTEIIPYTGKTRKRPCRAHPQTYGIPGETFLEIKQRTDSAKSFMMNYR